LEALQANTAQSESLSVDVMRYLHVLFRRRWVILVTLAAVVVGAGFYTLRQPKVYSATASLIIDTSAPRVLDNQVQEVVDTGTGAYWFNKEHFETQYKVIVSRAVSKRVVDKLGLDSDLSFLGLSNVKDPAGLKDVLSRVDAVAVLQSKIRVRPVKDSRMVYVVIEDFDPDRAALLANEVAQAYIAENLSLKTRTTETAGAWLEERLGELEQKSKHSDISMYDFKKREDMLTTSLEDRQSMVSQRLNATNLALTEIKTRLAGLKARVEAINKVRRAAKNDDLHWAEGLPASTENTLIPDLKMRYASQTSECAELKERYLAGHPKLAQCMEKLESVKQDLVHELTNIVRAAEFELAEATAKERNLATLFEQAKAEAFDVNKKQIEFDRIKREADNDQRLYDLVLKRLKDIELSGLLRTSNVRILDPARPEKTPISPRVMNSLLIALMLGLLAGIALALGLELLDDTISSQAEVEAKLGLPFLGFLPRISDEVAPNESSRDLHIHHQPKSSAAECCRAIRTNLLFMSPDMPLKTMLVTSSGPQEGKSSSVINIGIAMAQSGSRVLVIDTDMRRPRLHKAFGVPNDSGVSSLVVSNTRLDDCIKSTEVPGLFVLPCGPIPPNPAELFHTRAFSELLKRLAEKFDRVILDSPPIAAVADAAVLATQVEGVVLVIKAGRTSRNLVKRGFRSLQSVNAKVFGAILNDMDLDNPRYSDSYYVYQRYGYYYGEKKGVA
jgi:capsular exopolysaccharide synthesis family protein